ncbi:MAG: hypothetical protein COA78_14595 [Blastopirellula sp.]|nr:MAG: hypothetical protein COA78_14595 [Blastopirellula sp.]
MKEVRMLNSVSFPGSTPKFVLLHGLGGSTRYWTSVMDFSMCDQNVLAIDLLGFGDSPKPYFQYSMEKHLQALALELDELEDIVLVGHSLGAMLALAYVSRYPQKVRNLILIGLPYFGDMQRARQWFARRSGGWIYTNYAAMLVACIFTRRIASYFLPFFIKSYPKEVVQDLVKHNIMSSTTSLWNVLYQYDPIPDCERLPKGFNVTCIHSEDDDLAPFHYVKQLVQTYGWSLERFNGVQHHPWLRNPDRCWSIICGEQGS